MATFVSELEPRALWAHFDRILSIPRPSKKEAAARAYVREVAASRSLECREDSAGNLVVVVPATAGREAAPTVVLQSHLDMVCEKNAGVEHDFDRDPIVPRRDGDWLYATGTTLGSDNGIGAAAMLAVASGDGLVHGPLELLFTVEEEIGLNGAAALDPALVTGRILLNLDTEEEGALYVGCAGGAGSELAIPLDTMFGVEGRSTLRLRVGGLLGGHSGVDIHLQRGNALQILARTLQPLWPEFQFEVASISGGNLTNAIPREAEAVIRFAPEDRDRLEKALGSLLAARRAELASVDPGLEWSLEPAECGPEVLADATTERILALLAALPHGVLRMSDDIPELVETSTNLARVRTEGTTLRISMSNRSSVDSALAATQQQMKAFAVLAGGEAVSSEGYPGWKPNLDSPLLATVKGVHERVLGSAPEVKAIHAGLECGVLGAKLPGCDMLSVGPQIEHPHSPDERVGIGSVGRFWKLLGAALEELAQG
ncbi:MAG TPA: aminoacyl-histidine dipeptidase [Thermoanaerobaculia bacterium]|nr:aminoacyl-histidine dipeptidase [Thermoanaerobaculia bacterium]